MNNRKLYRDLDGHQYWLAGLDADENKLLGKIRKRFETKPDWDDFDNYWVKAVVKLYEARGLSGRAITQAPVYMIAQDLSMRIALAAGLTQLDDYRSQLEMIALTRFKTRREFCQVVGLSEDMFSHLCAGRKHLSMETLTEVLTRLGCMLRIVSLDEIGLASNGADAKKRARRPLASASK
jgi:hypothetical protein